MRDLKSFTFGLDYRVQSRVPRSSTLKDKTTEFPFSLSGLDSRTVFPVRPRSLTTKQIVPLVFNVGRSPGLFSVGLPFRTGLTFKRVLCDFPERGGGGPRYVERRGPTSLFCQRKRQISLWDPSLRMCVTRCMVIEVILFMNERGTTVVFS